MIDWPVTEPSPVEKLHAMAQALPGCVVVERDYSVSADALWQHLSDLGSTVPKIQSHVRRLSILSRSGDHLDLRVDGYLGVRTSMRAVLQPHWCVMQSRFLVIVMAVDATANGARLARLQCVRINGMPIPGFAIRRNLRAELERLARLTEHPPDRSQR